MSGHEWPTCGKRLPTLRGMRQHHAKVHDEHLPNRACEGCGTGFHDAKAQRTYCDDCNPEAGEHDGNWKGANEEAVRHGCGEQFEHYPSEKDGVFCPDCVAESDEFLGTPSWEGEETPIVTTGCEYCGDDVRMRESKRAYGSGRFRSTECKYAWMSENLRWEDHPRWDGGWDDRRNRNWKSARRKSLDRDGHRCRNCGVTREELARKPDVHHIVPIRSFDDPTDAHTLDNLITRCRSCHVAIEHGQLPVPDRDR